MWMWPRVVRSVWKEGLSWGPKVREMRLDEL